MAAKKNSYARSAQVTLESKDPQKTSLTISKSKPVVEHSAVTVPLSAARKFIDELLSRAVANELAGVNAFTVTDVVHTLCTSSEQVQARYDDTMPCSFTEVLRYVCQWYVTQNMYAPKGFNSKTANMEMSIRELSDFNNQDTSAQQYALYCKNMCDSFRKTFDTFLATGQVGTKLPVSLSPSQRTSIERYAYPLFAVQLDNRDPEFNTLITMFLAIHETELRCSDNIDIMIKQLTMLMKGDRYNVTGAIKELYELQGKLKNIFVWEIPSNYKTYILHVKNELNDLLTNYAMYVSAAFMKCINEDKLNNNEFVEYNKRMAQTKKTISYNALQTFTQKVVPQKFKNTGEWTDKSFKFSLDKGPGKDPSIFTIMKGNTTEVGAKGTDIKLTKVVWTDTTDVKFNLKFSDGNVSKTYFHFKVDTRELKS